MVRGDVRSRIVRAVGDFMGGEVGLIHAALLQSSTETRRMPLLGYTGGGGDDGVLRRPHP